ncbi:MAG: cytochrome c oxidase subunit 3 [Bacteroidia bacterium]
MSAESTTIPKNVSRWSGGIVPMGSSYGKLMMWFFLLSDAFTFSTLLVTYGFIRIGSEKWANPEAVFKDVPFIHGVELPLVFVGIMTFILITSSVTMVLGVEAGHRMDRKAVEKYMLLTILGGAAFLGCQAWEWSHLIVGGTTIYGNPWGDLMFGQLFFIITGFHGFHVFSGLVILFIVYLMVKNKTLEKRGHYEMVEKVGLYWHFVDLVWVFVFTLFYLI